jgi:arylformamidase
MQPKFLSYFIDTKTPVYGGLKDMIKIKKINSILNGDTSNNLSIEFPLHIGTHIDFPFHFSEKGKKSDDYPPSFWIFSKIGYLNCRIEEVEKNLNTLPLDIEILLLKTDFGINRNNDIYWSQQPIIPSYLASVLRKKFLKLRVFGFDLISLTSKLNREEGKKAHIEFLIKNEILLIEDMDLKNLTETPSMLIVSPLQIREADGVPCTVFSF